MRRYLFIVALLATACDDGWRASVAFDCPDALALANTLSQCASGAHGDEDMFAICRTAALQALCTPVSGCVRQTCTGAGYCPSISVPLTSGLCQ